MAGSKLTASVCVRGAPTYWPRGAAQAPCLADAAPSRRLALAARSETSNEYRKNLRIARAGVVASGPCARPLFGAFAKLVCGDAETSAIELDRGAHLDSVEDEEEARAGPAEATTRGVAGALLRGFKRCASLAVGRRVAVQGVVVGHVDG